MSANGQKRAYHELVERVRRVVRRSVPRGAAVVVVSKGDTQLIDFDDRRGLHFPQRTDGVYAGHYPADSASATAHLEALRRRGAEFFVIPAPCLWWRDHYPEFREHLEQTYKLLVQDEHVCFLYALFDVRDPGAAANRGGVSTSRRRPASRSRGLETLDERLRDDLNALVDLSHYSKQVDQPFENVPDAIRHYVNEGAGKGYDPHPLFDTSYYVEKTTGFATSGENPLVHFLRYGAQDELDPNPYFDTAYYFEQGVALRRNGGNPLVHYIRYAAANQAYAPNPLFGNGFYLAVYPEIAAAGLNPLAHYLTTGCHEGRLVSHIHEGIVAALRRRGRSPLLRGNWKDGNILAVSRTLNDDEALLVRAAEALSEEHHIDSVTVALRRGRAGSDQVDGVVLLEDFTTARDVLRPSALRLLAKSMSAKRPLFALTDVADVLEGLEDAGVPAYYFASADDQAEELRIAREKARRIVFGSSSAFSNAGAKLGEHPTRVALIVPEHVRDESRGVAGYARALLDLARRDLDITGEAAPRRRGFVHKKIVIPCSDWTVSGVNASLEAVGKELVARGWDVEVLFTRDEEFVLETAHEVHLPQLPYRFLHRTDPGAEGMWQALVAYLERSAPCVMFMGYDFVANSVVPALGDGVAAVAWAQADDGDYYEQVYRLGRYCNAVVCVSNQIKARVAELNPRIGECVVVIHNSSVCQDDVNARRRRRRRQLRLVYTGRLVQYQKRVLDFVQLAEALDNRGVAYEIRLIGTFPRHESVEDEFRTIAGRHLDDGRLQLLGRLPRDRILEELSEADFFVLLSDFEGLPLSLVESMARGCVPVVARSESGIPELIVSGENGLVIEGRDYSEWAGQLVDHWEDRRAYAAMSKRCADTIRRDFTIERVADQFEELFARVLDEVSTGSYARPPALHWGEKRSQTGDVLPPPSLYRPVTLAGLR
jgi:glycosyltransferase involved in cell wall biosynthesis